MSSESHIDRRLKGLVSQVLAASPVVAVTGPRTAGKSTLARGLLAELGGTFLDLDNPSVRALAVDDPQAFVHGVDEPVIVDEFQRAPDLLAAIKAELNIDRRPGRFVLTGSARPQVVSEFADYLTGRVDLLTLWPFAQAELVSNPTSIVDRLFDNSLLNQRRTSAMERPEVVELVLRGGYPIAVGLSPRPRTRWFANLATLIVERVGEDVAPVHRPDILARFLRLSAARTAQLLNVAELGRDAGLGRDQAGEYLRLLKQVYLVIDLPAWSTNITSRVTKSPKLHLVDSGFAAYLHGITVERLSPIDPAAVNRFGALLETFVVTEVLKQMGWAEQVATAHHYRTSDGIEVDLVLETLDGRVAAIEVKAGSKVNPAATAGLAHLRDNLGDRFVAGILLTTGSHAQRLGDRLAVAPIDSLWYT